MIKINQQTALDFLYNTVLGRILLKPLTCKGISVLAGKFLDSSFSTVFINSFIRNNNIDEQEYQKRKYTSFNDYFTRKGVSGFRTLDVNPDSFISPCDSALTVHRITSDSRYSIKNSMYTVADLLRDDELAKEYEDGYIFIFRLAVNNYHRYCFVDNSTILSSKKIDGKFHTVMPIALNSCNVYSENTREYTVLETKSFDKIIQCEVGAMLVGRISNNQYLFPVRRGQEKGKFEFGGSTIIVLVKKDTVAIRKDIAYNSVNGIETNVLIGEKIGQKL